MESPDTSASPASDSPASEPVLLTIDGGVATITFNRPDALNALDVASKVALRAFVEQVAADDAVRCVVLTGSGRAFCVGQDLKEHIGILASPDASSLFNTVDEHYNPTVHALATMPKPVIAAVNGVAAGAGASLTFACDLRIVAESAGFNLAFAQIALSCDTGASWTLPRLVGPTRAMELLYFPRTVPAAEAASLGLATEVVPDDEFAARVRELAERLAAGPTLALASMRAAVRYAATHDLADALVFESERMTLTGASADHDAAVQAFLRKQPPTFEGR
ncbi:MAG: enoyl-CoA hydratase-related protein [Nocardioides sp.]